MSNPTQKPEDRVRASPPSSSSGERLSELCKEVVAHLIAGASWFACALPKGHEGGHRASGNCFTHGEYLGEPFSVPQCPKWPECTQGARLPAAPSPTPSVSTDLSNDELLDLAKEFSHGPQGGLYETYIGLKDFYRFVLSKRALPPQEMEDSPAEGGAFPLDLDSKKEK